MEITDEMLQAAMTKAVQVGLVPKYAISEETYLKNWEAVREIIQAALNKAPNTNVTGLAP